MLWSNIYLKMLSFRVNGEKPIFYWHAPIWLCSTVIFANLLANLDRDLSLCTDLLNSLNQRFPVGANFFVLGETQEGHAHITPQAHMVKIRKSDPEGRRDSIFSLKWPQWPHLCKCYEATYTLKCLVFVKIAKNRFCSDTRPFVFRKLLNVILFSQPWSMDG